MIAALELDARFARAGHAVAYLAAERADRAPRHPRRRGALLGAALSVIGIGLPLLVAAAAACRALVRADRRAANRWLDTHIPPVPGPRAHAGRRVPALARPARRTARCGGSRRTWRSGPC